MKFRKRIIGLQLFMVVSIIAVCGLTNVMLYRISIDAQKDRLMETVKSRARMIEAIASDVHMREHGDVQTRDHIIRILSETEQTFKGLGETGEYTIAEKKDDFIHFLVHVRYAEKGTAGDIPFASENAVPMYYALTQKEGGAVIAKDYRKKVVLAAYEPVKVYGLGIVAKIDLDEIMNPYIRAWIISALISIVFVCVALVSLARFKNSHTRELETVVDELKRENELRRKTEEQVFEKNSDLEAANEELVAINEEHERAQEELMRSQEELEHHYNLLSESEKLIQKALAEKESLLKELYHRTKNNMQVICALINMQGERFTDKKVLDSLKDVTHRILSMAIVHQMLYKSESLTHINFGEYLNDLSRHIAQGYSRKSGQIECVIEYTDIFLSIDSAIPCGLVVNEMMINSYKYAFPDERPGKIHVELSRNDDANFCLRCSDNGVGLVPGLDLRKSLTLGSTLIYNIVEGQLRGTVSYVSLHGLSREISFQEKVIVNRAFVS